MPNNPLLFNAALAGATGGVHERWITSQDPANYATIRNQIVVFATAVDSVIANDLTTNAQDAELMSSICQQILAGRWLDSLTAQNTSDIALSIKTLYNVMRPQLAVVDTSKTNVQTFITPGGTWTKPLGAKTVDIYLFPTGGPGGSGRKSDPGTGASGGASGGTGTPKILLDVSADNLGATEPVIVGIAGVGGAAVTIAQTNGNPGVLNASNTTSFGSILSTIGATAGNGGGTTGNTSPGSSPSGLLEDLSVTGTLGAGGGNGSTGTSGGSPAPSIGSLPSSGAGGGAVNAAGTTVGNGGSSGANGIGAPSIPGGIAPGGDGTPGTNQPLGSTFGGLGASGGAASAIGDSGAGAKGGFPGGSGSGSGAVQGAGTVKKGGDGGDACVVVITRL
jgi:hypothetical protein